MRYVSNNRLQIWTEITTNHFTGNPFLILLPLGRRAESGGRKKCWQASDKSPQVNLAKLRAPCQQKPRTKEGLWRTPERWGLTRAPLFGLLTCTHTSEKLDPSRVQVKRIQRNLQCSHESLTHNCRTRGWRSKDNKHPITLAWPSDRKRQCFNFHSNDSF